MNCPKCYSKMENTRYKELDILRCVGCKGLWFNPNDLAELRKNTWMADYILDEGKPKVGREYNRVRDIACPECKSGMNQDSDAEQPHIIYEVCPQGHGVFLDAGEFTDLVHKTFWDRFKPAQ